MFFARNFDKKPAKIKREIQSGVYFTISEVSFIDLKVNGIKNVFFFHLGLQALSLLLLT